MDLKFKDNSKLKLAPVTQLEYIESTGTQYIDTGVIQSGTDYLIEIEFSRKDTTSSVIANDNNNITGGGGLLVVGQPSNGIIRFGNQYISEWPINDYNKHYLKLEYTNGSVTLTKDNTSINKGAATNPTVPYTICAFVNKRSGNIIGYNSLKLYSFHVKVDDNEVNFIPCKDLNGVVCLYDLVSEQFFYNQGTGDFIAGPEVPSTITSLQETIRLKITTLYHKNTPNVDGLQLLNDILNYQKTHQDEIKEYYYPTTQLWQDIITEYPDIVQYYDMNHKLCVIICEADDPEQCAEDFLDTVEDYPDLIPIITDNPSLISIIAENPEVVHSLVDTGYETTLTSSGTQYIDTRFVPDGSTKIECTFNVLQNTNNRKIFGCGYDWNNKAFAFGLANSSTNYYYFTYNNTEFKDTNVQLRKTVILGNGIQPSVVFSAPRNLTLFAFNYDNLKIDSGLSFYSCKLYSSDNLILWLIPIQNNGNPCMIDLLTGTKYLNQGTGSFTYSLEPKNT